MEKDLFNRLSKFYELEKEFFEVKCVRSDYMQVMDIRTKALHCLRF